MPRDPAGARARAAEEERPQGAFLIARSPRELRRGQAITILEFAETREAARAWVDELEDSTPGFLLILELKARLERRPQMVVVDVDAEK